MIRKITLAASLLLSLAPVAAHAQVLTYDSQSYLQQAAEWTEHLAQLKNQLEQAKNIFGSLSGVTNYGSMLNSSVSMSKSVLPTNWSDAYSDAAGSGSRYLSAANSLQNTFSGRINGMNNLDGLSYSLRQLSNKGATDRVMGETLYNDNYRQLDNVNTLTQEINSTQSLKESSDLHARITAQQAEIAAQDQKIRIMDMQQRAQDRLLEEQRRLAVQKYALGDPDTPESQTYDFSE